MEKLFEIGNLTEEILTKEEPLKVETKEKNVKKDNKTLMILCIVLLLAVIAFFMYNNMKNEN